MAKNIPAGLMPELYRKYTTPLTIVELYLESPFTSISHRYVANNENITFGGEIYTALAAKRSAIRSEEGTILNELEVGLDNIDLEFKTLISSGALNRKRCVIKLVFDGFLTDAANYVMLMDGYLDNPKGDNRWCTLTIKPFPILEREYPRRIFQVGCNWKFGDAQCSELLTDWDSELTVLAGSTASVLQFADTDLGEDYFVPGYVVFTSGTLTGEVRPIALSDDTTITLRVSLSAAPTAGDTFTAQKLCPKDIESCNDIFGNKNNFGAFPSVPKQPIL